MTKVAIITDIHLGCRSDSSVLLKKQEQFFQNIFFPELQKRKIDTVIDLGDVFHKRKNIDFKTLEESRRFYFDNIRMYDYYIIVGNHDTYYKSTNNTNSVELVLSDYDFKIYRDPEYVQIKGYDVLFVPWITPENQEETLKMISESNATIAMGHLELQNFLMTKTRLSEHGLDGDIFKKFKIVLSGHYHLKSSNKNIHYLGSANEQTWEDWNTHKGFHIFDLETHELEHIKNPYTLFKKIDYTEETEYEDVEGMYVKVHVKEKENFAKFEKYIEKLRNSKPSSLTVVEDEVTAKDEQSDDVEIEDTLSIINQYVDNLEGLQVPSNDLKDLFSELYRGANQVEI